MATVTETVLDNDDSWNSYPTVIVKGNVIKTLQKPFTFEEIKSVADSNSECQAFTSSGQLLAGLYDVKQWQYDKEVTSYIKLPLQPPISLPEPEPTKDPTQEQEQISESTTTPTPTPTPNIAPKILHYIYETENVSLMPKHIRQAIVHNINTFKNWDFRLYTPQKIHLFLEKEFPSEYKDTFDVIQSNPRKKEFINLLILKKYGGLYTDIALKLNNVINLMIKKPTTVYLSNRSIVAFSCHSNDKLVTDLIDHYMVKKNEVTQRSIENIIYNTQDVTVMK